MLSVNDSAIKETTSTLSSLLSKKGEGEGKSSFASLLSQISIGSKSKDTILPSEKNSELKENVAELKTEDKNSVLSLLLQEKDSKKLDIKSDTKDVLRLISDAKEYLKGKITTKAKELGVEIEKTPKTLKGLVSLAKDLGIKVESISIQEVKNARPKENKVSLLAKPTQEKNQTNIEEVIPKRVEKEKVITPIKTTNVVETKEEAPISTVAKTATNIEDKKLTTILPETIKEAKPLSTSEIVIAKSAVISTAEVKNSTLDLTKESKEKPLESLLKALHVEKKEETILPNVTSDKISNTLSKLLHPTSTQTSAEVTTQNQVENAAAELRVDNEPKNIINTMQTKESELEIKVKEAKQFVSQFANDIKEEIKNYKPPFVRLKMKLNPAKMGEVDVTLVQRGNSVHININSNTTAITTLMQNAQELKTQLNVNGVSNATMNFQSGSNEQQQQQQQHRQKEITEAYEKFNNSDEYDTIATSLEIIVPRYV